jgi:hypothetical protein
MLSRSRCVIALVVLAAWSAAVSAQSGSAITSAIQCADCGLAGQKPEPSTAGGATQVVERIAPVFFEGITLRMEFIARVLDTAPLTLEVLDSRSQQLDRRMTVVMDDIHGGKDPGTCGMALTPVVTRATKPIASTLVFNDLVRGAWMLHQDTREPQSALFGRPALSEIRKVSEPVPYFHPTPGTERCLNRSGSLIEYVSPMRDRLVVYNDGGIHYYNNTTHRYFSRQRVSAQELAEVLRAFGDASFETLPPAVVKPEHGTPPTISLIAARRQVVQAEPADDRLLPVIARMKALAARAMSDVRLLLKAGAMRTVGPLESSDAPDLMAALAAQAARTFRVTYNRDGTLASRPEPADLAEFPQSVHPGQGKYTWPRDMGVSLLDIPPGGRTISSEEFEKHKPVYNALLKAQHRGLTLIEGDRMFESVRLCQIEPGVQDSCEPR